MHKGWLYHSYLLEAPYSAVWGAVRVGPYCNIEMLQAQKKEGKKRLFSCFRFLFNEKTEEKGSGRLQPHINVEFGNFINYSIFIYLALYSHR